MNTSLIAIQILYDHIDFLIINKPIGVPMHDPTLGIISLLKTQLNTTQLYLVHRLDTPTSGCLLVAKNRIAAASLSALFAQRQVNKYYIALIDTKPRKKQGTISGDMINRRGGQHALLRTKQNPAITQFQTFSIEPGIRVAVVKPLTGKTHQIRVALKSVGAPIIGDERYKGTQADRLYLHAWKLVFQYADELINCCAPINFGVHFQVESFSQWQAKNLSPEHLSWP